MFAVVLILLLDRVICQVYREVSVVQRVTVGGHPDVTFLKQKTAMIWCD